MISKSLIELPYLFLSHLYWLVTTVCIYNVIANPDHLHSKILFPKIFIWSSLLYVVNNNYLGAGPFGRGGGLVVAVVGKGGCGSDTCELFALLVPRPDAWGWLPLQCVQYSAINLQYTFQDSASAPFCPPGGGWGGCGWTVATYIMKTVSRFQYKIKGKSG